MGTFVAEKQSATQVILAMNNLQQRATKQKHEPDQLKRKDLHQNILAGNLKEIHHKYNNPIWPNFKALDRSLSQRMVSLMIRLNSDGLVQVGTLYHLNV